MGCGCGGGGGRRQAAAPKLPAATGKVAESASKLHPSIVHMQNIQKVAEEQRRKVEKLKREQLLKALARH